MRILRPHIAGDIVYFRQKDPRKKFSAKKDRDFKSAVVESLFKTGEVQVKYGRKLVTVHREDLRKPKKVQRNQRRYVKATRHPFDLASDVLEDQNDETPRPVVHLAPRPVSSPSPYVRRTKFDKCASSVEGCNAITTKADGIGDAATSAPTFPSTAAETPAGTTVSCYQHRHY